MGDSLVDFEENTDELGKSKKGAGQQKTYDTRPSPSYVRWVTNQHNIQTFGQGRMDKLEVKIANSCEKIRNLVLHCRDHYHDYRAREQLIKECGLRRALMNKLATSNLDSYLSIREELQITHAYRLDCLCTRDNRFVLMKNRRQYPGVKGILKIQRARALWSRRLKQCQRMENPRAAKKRGLKSVKYWKDRLNPYSQWGGMNEMQFSMTSDEAKQLVRGVKPTVRIERGKSRQEQPLLRFPGGTKEGLAVMPSGRGFSV